jgi:hypothetical protein
MTTFTLTIKHTFVTGGITLGEDVEVNVLKFETRKEAVAAAPKKIQVKLAKTGRAKIGDIWDNHVYTVAKALPTIAKLQEENKKLKKIIKLLRTTK